MKRAVDALYGLLASIGVMSLALFIGLYQAGFFHWYAGRFPDNAVMHFLFGATP